jgi:hypothetical protein
MVPIGGEVAGLRRCQRRYRTVSSFPDVEEVQEM